MNKKWIVIGGTTTAFALAPLAAAYTPSAFADPMPGGGVVVTAATSGPAEATASPEAGGETGDAPTVSPASPLTPNGAATAASPVTPPTASSPPSPVSPASPMSPKTAASAQSPASPQTP
jgi:hypothetical protein